MQEATVRFEARLHAAAAMYVQGLHTLPAGSEAAQVAAATSTGALEDEVMEVEAAHAVLPLDMPAAQVDTPQHDSVLDVNLERLGSLGSSLCSYTALITLHARSNQLTRLAGETTVPSRLCKAMASSHWTTVCIGCSGISEAQQLLELQGQHISAPWSACTWATLAPSNLTVVCIRLLSKCLKQWLDSQG